MFWHLNILKVNYNYVKYQIWNTIDNNNNNNLLIGKNVM